MKKIISTTLISLFTIFFLTILTAPVFAEKAPIPEEVIMKIEDRSPLGQILKNDTRQEKFAEEMKKVYEEEEKIKATLESMTKKREKIQELAKILQEGIFFADGSYDLSDEAKKSIAEKSVIMKELIKLIGDLGKIFVASGKTDAIGSEEDNLVLSAKRAQSVIDESVKNGIPPVYFSISPFGEYRAATTLQEISDQTERVVTLNVITDYYDFEIEKLKNDLLVKTMDIMELRSKIDDVVEIPYKGHNKTH